MTAQEVVVVKNLFQDQKVLMSSDPYATCDSSLSQKRSSTAMNYNSIKSSRVADMTLRAKNPRLSLSIDPGTGIVGQIPGFYSIKNTHKEKVKPFFSPLRSDKSLPRVDSSSNTVGKTKVDWLKITDPN